jgi:hypothetical protein
MRPRNYFLIAGVTVLLVALGLIVSPVTAAQPEGKISQPAAALPAVGENDACLACHQNPQFKVDLGNGDSFELFVNPDEFTHSVHGDSGITCMQCHVGFEPSMGHGLKFGSRREATLRLNETCAQCHKTQSDQEKDSAHAAARASGKMEAAICTDCHTAHAVQRLKDAATGQLLPATRIWIPTTCQKCHSAIYEKYRNSVHGAALTDANNPDVPTCIDCHGVHIIENPTTSAFRLNSPQICAKCHTDPKRMDKYGISTQVLNTYVADFHGTTVTIFEQTSPDAATNKPVCYDCHGIHDITRVDDPQKGLAIKANILAKCQKCHPDASSNFPDSWMSHYIPSPEKYPIVYYVNLFYKIFIPGVLGSMGLLVVMDFSRLMINRFRKRRPVKHPLEKAKLHEKPKASEKAVATEEVKVVETPVETEAAEKATTADEAKTVETSVQAEAAEKAKTAEEVKTVETPIETEVVEKTAPVETPAETVIPSTMEPEENPAESEPNGDRPSAEKPNSNDEEAQHD